MVDEMLVLSIPAPTSAAKQTMYDPSMKSSHVPILSLPGLLYYQLSALYYSFVYLNIYALDIISTLVVIAKTNVVVAMSTRRRSLRLGSRPVVRASD
jgi:hypothetical protein